MRQLTDWLSVQSGKVLTFVEYDGFLLHFGIEERWTYHATHLDGSETPAKEVLPYEFNGRMLPCGGYPKYFAFTCYPCQLTDDDAVYLLKNGLTQKRHERFEQ